MFREVQSLIPCNNSKTNIRPTELLMKGESQRQGSQHIETIELLHESFVSTQSVVSTQSKALCQPKYLAILSAAVGRQVDAMRGIQFYKRICLTSTQTKWWLDYQWNNVVFSDELFTLSHFLGRVYVWRQLKDAFNPDCFPHTRKLRGGFVNTSRKSLDPFVFLHDTVNANYYLSIFVDLIMYRVFQ